MELVQDEILVLGLEPVKDLVFNAIKILRMQWLSTFEVGIKHAMDNLSGSLMRAKLL